MTSPAFGPLPGCKLGKRNQSPPWLNGTPIIERNSFASGDQNARRIQIVPIVPRSNCSSRSLRSRGRRSYCLAGCDQRVKQYQRAVFTRGKVVRCALWDMADHSQAKRNAAIIDAQPAATLEDLTDDVLIVVVDLL